MRLAYRLTDAPPVTLCRDGETHTFNDIPTGWQHSFIHAIRHLIDALHNSSQPRLIATEGRTILRFLLAAHQFGCTGQSVSV